MKTPCVYILASKRNGTLYIGVTSNLVQRVWQHKEGLADGFTKKYGIKQLVWYELHETMESAITREKALKEWQRHWKRRLIERANPYWRDLYGELLPHNDDRRCGEGRNPESFTGAGKDSGPRPAPGRRDM